MAHPIGQFYQALGLIIGPTGPILSGLLGLSNVLYYLILRAYWANNCSYICPADGAYGPILHAIFINLLSSIAPIPGAAGPIK